jgi:hypothetical protein
MTSFEAADQRIAAQEEELARLQTDFTAPSQFNLNLIRDELKSTLQTASQIAKVAVEVLDQLGDSFEESVEQMSKDLNGKG